MPKINESELKKEIKSGDFKNAYLLYGEESYLKEYYASELKNKIVDKTFEAFNFHYFDGKDTELDDILKDAQMLPMMSEYNFVMVKDYPIEKSANDIKLLEEYLKDAPDTTVFCFGLKFNTVARLFKCFNNLFKFSAFNVRLYCIKKGVKTMLPNFL